MSSGKECGSPSSPKKKPSFFERLFGRKSSSGGESRREDGRHQSSSDADQPTRRGDGNGGRNASAPTSPTKPKPKPSPILAPAPVRLQSQGTHGGACDVRGLSSTRNKQSTRPAAVAGRQNSNPSGRQQKSKKHRKRGGKKLSDEQLRAEASQPLEYPTTPELILAHHKARPFLNRNEEWLLVELNEFECLVDSLDIIRIIAKHSKFFEVEPDQLWEEFFEFVDEMPSYDEVINFDVWQEFRDAKYPC